MSSSKAQTPARGPVARLASPATLALAALLLAGGILIVYAGRHLGFFFDEWNIVLDRRQGGLSTVLDAHNGHPLVLPVIVYRALFELFGIDSYAPYRVVLVLLHLVACAALYTLARRRVGAWAALVPTALLLFLGAGWADLLWAFQIGYTGSVASGLLALVLLDGAARGDGDGRARGTAADVGACALLVASVAWSSIGIAFMAAVAVELLLDPVRRRRLWIVAIPIVLYGLWYLGYGGDDASRPLASNIVEIPQYVLDSAAAAVAGIAGLSAAWAPALLLFSLAAVWAARRAQGSPPPLSPRLAGLTVAVLLNWTLTALTRAQLNGAAESRYVYVGAVFLLLLAVELLAPPRRDLRLAAVAAVLTAAAVLSNVGLLRDAQRQLRGTWEEVRSGLTAVEIAGDEAPPEFQPDPQSAPQVTAGRYLAAVRALGSPALTASELLREPEPERAEADETLRELVVADAAPASRGAAAGAPALRVDGTFGGRREPAGACLRIVPAAPPGGAVEISVPAGASVGVFTRSGGPVDVRARRFADAFPEAPTTSVAAGTPAQLTLGGDDDGAAQVPWHLRVSASQAFAVCPR